MQIKQRSLDWIFQDLAPAAFLDFDLAAIWMSSYSIIPCTILVTVAIFYYEPPKYIMNCLPKCDLLSINQDHKAAYQEKSFPEESIIAYIGNINTH